MRGINYGHHLKTSDWINDSSIQKLLIEKELLDILSHGFRILRIDMPQWNGAPWTHPPLERRKWIVLKALSMGFDEVIWGIVHDRPFSTASSYSASKLFVTNTLLPWAQAVNSSKLTISIGNEEETHVDNTTLTSAQMRSNLLSLATESKATYTKGKITLAISIDSCYGPGDVWSDNSIGALDLLDVNIYKGVLLYYAGFYDAIKNVKSRFGNKFRITEYNIGLGYPATAQYGTNYREKMFTKMNIARRDLLDNLNIDWCYFAYAANDNQHNEPNDFALKLSDGNYRELWRSL